PAIAAGKKAPGYLRLWTEAVDARLETILGVLIAAVALLHVPLVFRRNINWDEFRFLSDIYSYQQSLLASSMQTFHVHLLSWLPGIGVNEIDQVFAGRIAYYLLLLGCVALIYRIALELVSRRS